MSYLWYEDGGDKVERWAGHWGTFWLRVFAVCWRKALRWDNSPDRCWDGTVSPELLANNSLGFCQARNSYKNNFTSSWKKNKARRIIHACYVLIVGALCNHELIRRRTQWEMTMVAPKWRVSFSKKRMALYIKLSLKFLWLNTRLRGAWVGREVHRPSSLSLHETLEFLPWCSSAGN